MLVRGILAEGWVLLFPLGIGLFFRAAFCFHLFVGVTHGRVGGGHGGWGVSERAVMCIFFHLVPIYFGLRKADFWFWFCV